MTPDMWAMAANRHLLAHLLCGLKSYAPDSHYSASTFTVVPGERSKDQADVLVQYKNAWAQDMRDDGTPTPEFQKTAWADCMSRADAAIASLPKQLEMAA